LAVVALAGAGAAGAAKLPDADRTGLAPLRVLPANPRYFTDGSGRAVYLTGSHTWENLVDRGRTSPPPQFDFDRYLDLLTRHGHNFIRLWTWEFPRVVEGHLRYARPQPWPRAGPVPARDGLPKFDLSRFDAEYFDRLRERVLKALDRGIYVSVMLFEGFAVQFGIPPSNWEAHPFNGENNVNGLDGDVNGDGNGLEVHTLANPAVTEVQKAYVRKVIDTVGDLPNVLFEVANEAHPGSTAWQYAMVEHVKQYAGAQRSRALVGMTFQYFGGSNETLIRSPADWISPGGDVYLSDPPVADGRKVSVSDTDHQCGVCGGRVLVWKGFLRGHNVILMDPLEDHWWLVDARAAMGHTRQFARRIDLRRVVPRPELATTRYCLADPGSEYLVYQPGSGAFTVDLRGTSRLFRAEWFDPDAGRTVRSSTVRGGTVTTFTPPFSHDAVLYLRAV
jgi:hypothetical protein